jgi:radical SAM protein with 4Fe4S-binding SPASM domain
MLSNLILAQGLRMHIDNPWRAVYDLPESIDPFIYGVPAAPLYLDIEPTNHCNMECLFCTGQQQGKRSRGFMDFNLFIDIVEMAYAAGVKGIRFLRWGEPLLSPKLFDMIKLVKSFGMLTHVTTNGKLLTVENITKLIDSGLDSIIVSFQGVDDAGYREMRKESSENIVSNLMNLKNMRDKTHAKKPHIAVSTTVTDENKAAIRQFEESMMMYADHVGVGYTWFKRLNDRSAVKDIVPRAQKLTHNFKCIEVMNKVSIDWDGIVSPCCLDYDQQLTIGDIKKNTLMEIWTSQNLKAIQHLLQHKQQDLFVLCSTCELNYDFRGKK